MRYHQILSCLLLFTFACQGGYLDADDPMVGTPSAPGTKADQPGATPTNPPVVADPQHVAAGESVYLSQCASCHGVDGMGTAFATGLMRNLTLEQIETIVDLSMPPAVPETCTGECATSVAHYVYASITAKGANPIAEPPIEATMPGAAAYTNMGCAGCHGLNGQGTTGIIGVTANYSVGTLTNIIATTMPTTNPALCVGDCASDIASYIFETFTDREEEVVFADALANFPRGSAQNTIACNRMAQSAEDHVVRDFFCGAEPPTITSLRSLQAGLGLEFVNAGATGRQNNGQGGNPGFAITGHSSSLVGKFVNAINPRAVIFNDDGPGFVTMGFTRGDQFVELIVRDRNRDALSFFLVSFKQACNAGNGCTNGDLLTPAIERNWQEVTLYSEEDIKNTIFDCQQCHQVDGPGTPKMLRMQELQNPWNHWFRDNRDGGQALLADYFAAHGDDEEYAGIPGALIDASDPEELEDFIRDNGFRNQPNEFDSNDIEDEVNQTQGQPENNDIPGSSPTWDELYLASVTGDAIAPPYHDVKVTDSARLTTLTSAYADFVDGVLPAAELPDLRDAFLEERLHEIGFAADPDLDAPGILMQACSQCHNSRLDQSITRSRFNVDFTAMSDLEGGVLSGAQRDIRLGIAIDRLRLPKDDIRVMPPAHTFRTLTTVQIDALVGYLCEQTSTDIPQCE